MADVSSTWRAYYHNHWALKLGERSISEALCVAMSSVRNNEHIVSLILSAAEESNVTLSDDKYCLILETLLECKHKRVTRYTRKVLQSSISQEMSDKTFLTAVSTIMNRNLSNKELLHLILSHKPRLPQECRALLEGLKQTGRRVSRQFDATNEGMEINDDDVKDDDYEMRGDDHISVTTQEYVDNIINDDNSTTYHCIIERPDENKNKADEDTHIIDGVSNSVNTITYEGDRTNDNDIEMSDDDDDSV